jgi:hypothetical protein
MGGIHLSFQAPIYAVEGIGGRRNRVDRRVTMKGYKGMLVTPLPVPGVL